MGCCRHHSHTAQHSAKQNRTALLLALARANQKGTTQEHTSLTTEWVSGRHHFEEWTRSTTTHGWWHEWMEWRSGDTYVDVSEGEWLL